MNSLFENIFSQKNVVRSVLTVIAIGIVLLGAFSLANYVTTNETAQLYIASSGYGGIFLFSILTGLSLIPIPAVTFTPVFVAGGLTLPFIIIALIAGICVADGLGFYFGHYSKSFVLTKFPESYRFVHNIYTKRRRLVVPLVCLYIAFVPLPNEFVLIPLGVIGIPFRSLVVPIILGNTINQTYLALGIQNLFWWLG